MATATSTLFTKMRTIRKPITLNKPVKTTEIFNKDHEAQKFSMTLSQTFAQVKVMEYMKFIR